MKTIVFVVVQLNISLFKITFTYIPNNNFYQKILELKIGILIQILRIRKLRE